MERVEKAGQASVVVLPKLQNTIQARAKMNEIIKQEIEKIIGETAVAVSPAKLKHFLRVIAQTAYREGRNDALMGLMDTQQVADHFGVSLRRAQALMKNRHERFGVGMKIEGGWLIARDELEQLKPGRPGRP